MSNYFDSFYNTTVVYWAATGTDKYGKPTYSSPVEIKAFVYHDISNPVGENIQKYSESVSLHTITRVLNHSYVYVGALSDFTSGTAPQNIEGARLVTYVGDEIDFFGDYIYTIVRTK